MVACQRCDHCGRVNTEVAATQDTYYCTPHCKEAAIYSSPNSLVNAYIDWDYTPDKMAVSVELTSSTGWRVRYPVVNTPSVAHQYHLTPNALLALIDLTVAEEDGQVVVSDDKGVFELRGNCTDEELVKDDRDAYNLTADWNNNQRLRLVAPNLINLRHQLRDIGVLTKLIRHHSAECLVEVCMQELV